MKKRYLLWIVFVTSLFGCNNGDKMTKEKMEIIIREELPIGTSADKIENFFIERGLPFIFHAEDSKYKSRIPIKYGKGWETHVIVIKIYVDQGKRFTHADVYNVYTSIGPWW